MAATQLAATPVALRKPTPATLRPRRKVQIAPGMHVTLKPDFAGEVLPVTRLGRVAQALVEQTVVSTISVAAVTSYVYALTQAAAPQVTFTDLPPGMNNSQLAPLQAAYDQFLTQFAVFQGQAATWINTQQGSGTPSIFSQLVSIPTTLSTINATVSSNFTLLNSLTPGSPTYNQLLTQQENLIGAEKPAITALVAAVQTLGTNLDSGSSQLIASTQTGVLAQMLAAYAADIATLTNDINNCNNQISADNAKIVGEGVGAATSITVGLVGLANIWNPIGWFLLIGGAIGAYFAIAEIEVLKGQIAQLKGQINTDIAFQTTDEQAAMTMSAFCTQLQGFAAMNTAAQQELATLEALYSTLADDITLALTDLSSGDLSDAQNEWNTILQASAVLSGLTAYIWPSFAELSSPSSFAAIGNDVYYIATSGEMYHYTGSSGSWTDMGVTALSCAGQGTTLVAIDGAPLDGSVTTSNPTASTYFVKSYDLSAHSWTTISTFPAAAIAVGNGGVVYAINQTVSDRMVYQYSGSGSVWNALPQLPGPDAAQQIAVAGGVLFALSTNGQLVYQYNPSSSSWTQVFAQTCASITANGNQLGILGTNGYAYLYNPTISQPPVNYGAGVTQIAQLSTGNEYRTAADLSLWYGDFSVNPPAYTSVANNVTGVYASDTNLVYYADNLGNLFLIPSPGTVLPIPAIPS
ncbi:hypothetical protein [Tahibacter amnicola]|uniref:Uncharacterized protein n=1 Tax=Tahibacter amnicola TaxID=2976241 RepID=A0ABY6BJY3_9GAMM|nr:hypothetical protein [Tahibacter amnicola]UXI70199.1 hypothetical protein N4264_11370 [Tahibacter amnicola]